MGQALHESLCEPARRSCYGSERRHHRFHKRYDKWVSEVLHESRRSGSAHPSYYGLMRRLYLSDKR